MREDDTVRIRILEPSTHAITVNEVRELLAAIAVKPPRDDRTLSDLLERATFSQGSAVLFELLRTKLGRSTEVQYDGSCHLYARDEQRKQIKLHGNTRKARSALVRRSQRTLRHLNSFNHARTLDDHKVDVCLS
ncbi:hypothetical protein DES52_11634 [Deinococcus yavapaiensis KR-236]|uniref:Uncharacterized protein n=1 Tax=Deinococcus yavapaiensis KR-236 TaxID=694435 RepID=A0A318S3D9_9DEIO|nr:hypothetical protein DES52_11634 [Deinococcus yavapaiensis KR-236]